MYSRFNQLNVSNESKDVIETMPLHFSRGVANIVTHLLSGDIDTNFAGDPDTKPFTADERQQFRLFNKPIEKILTDRLTHSDPEAVMIANDILRGEEKNVNDALTLLAKKMQEDPDYLQYAVIASDPLGRKVRGTLLQIAAMAGDVDLKADIQGEKNRGLVERIAKAGNLSKEDVVRQLQVITSKEAQEANEKRSQRILNTIIKFGEDLIQKASEYKGKNAFKAFQNFCKPLIDELEIALAPDLNEVITSGFIFDTAILYQAAKWFDDNVKRFKDRESVESDVFWVNGFGKLQNKLSSRDVQVVEELASLVYSGQMPLRRLKNSVGQTQILGQNFYIGQYNAWTQEPIDLQVWRKYTEQKAAAFANLCSCQNKQNVQAK